MENIKYDVFLSRKSEDAHLAKEIYDFLTEKGLKVFDSDHSLQEMGDSDYSRSIDEVLTSVIHMLVIGSSEVYINSPWVEAEWRFFLNRKRSGKASGNLITIVQGDVLINSLPPSLQNFEILFWENNVKEKILKYFLFNRKTDFEETVQEQNELNDQTYKSNLEKELDLSISLVLDNLEPDKIEEIFKEGYISYITTDQNGGFYKMLLAANNEHPTAQFLVGEAYYLGSPPLFEPDKNNGVKYLKKSAINGNQKAMNMLEKLKIKW